MRHDHTTTYFSACSGIGGFELGIGRRARCIGYSEINRHAIAIYERHFDHRNYGDITRIDARDLPDFDLLVGGFPCQAFSDAGTRRGFADPRGTLFFELARIVREKRPRLLLFENVKGLLSHQEGRTFLRIVTDLDALGYDLQWQVLNSTDFGVPQNRERVFLVGHLRGTRQPEVFPIGLCDRDTFEQHLRFSDPVGIAPLWRVKDTARDRRRAMRGLAIRRLTPVEYERLQGFPDNWTAGISDTQRYKCLGNSVTVDVVGAIAALLLG